MANNGHGCSTIDPPPAPPRKPATPPPPTPVDEDGGEGGGDDWSFPVLPPRGNPNSENPFTVLHLTTTIPDNPMYVVVGVPFYAPFQFAESYRPGFPPPNLIGYYVFPVQYIEVQVRQYYRPPAPFIQVSQSYGQMPDHSPKHYRKMGWFANPPVTERLPVFNYSVGGMMVPFEPMTLDTPYSDWRIGTCDRLIGDPDDVVYGLACQSRNALCNPNWLQPTGPYQPFPQMAAAYDLARQTIPLVCANGWESEDE